MSEKKLPTARAAYRDSIRGLSNLIDISIRSAIGIGSTRIVLQRENIPEYITSKLKKAGYKINQARNKANDKIVLVISWEIEDQK